jgi:hypothetical protein
MKDRETLDMIERQLGKENKPKETWFKDIKEKNTLIIDQKKEEIKNKKK